MSTIGLYGQIVCGENVKTPQIHTRYLILFLQEVMQIPLSMNAICWTMPKSSTLLGW